MLDSKALIVIPVKKDEVRIASGQARHFTETGFGKNLNILYAFNSDCTAHDIWRVHRNASKAFKSVQHVQPSFELSSGFCLDNWLIQSAIMRMMESNKTEVTVLPPDAFVLRDNWQKLIGIGIRKKIDRSFPVTRNVQSWIKSLNVTDPPWWKNIGSKGFFELEGDNHWKDVPIDYGTCWGRESGKRLISLAEHSEESKERPLIRIRRWAAIGDVIASTAVAKKLNREGYDVEFVSHSSCAESLQHSPDVRRVQDNTQKTFHVNLDETYEKHPEWAKKHIRDIFFESARKQLIQHGVQLGEAENVAPVLGVSEVERSVALSQYQKHPKPWVLFCPKSHMLARSVPPEVMGRLKGQVSGTLFWYSGDPAPEGFVDLNIRTIRQGMSYISEADLVVTVDTATLHMAAGLKKPTVAIKQSFDPALRISDQRDVTTFQKSGLDCISCNAYVCKIDKDKPPCADLEPRSFASVINSKLEGIFGETVSAVIPIYGPNTDRINKVLQAVLPQVDEVILVLDGTKRDLYKITKSPKIKVVMHKVPKQYGYGRTCNLGARESTGRYILMLNDDCYPYAGMVDSMKKRMKSDVAVVGGLLWKPDRTIQHGGTRFSGNNFAHIDSGRRQPSIREDTQMDFVTFAAALVRRSVFFELDGFDERYFMYYEDSDFCLRCKEAGYKVIYTPEAQAVHEGSISTNGMINHYAGKGAVIFEERWRHKFKDLEKV